MTGRQWLILLMVQLSNMLFGMTITLANLVLPQMRGTLSATQDEISWVVTLNLVATAVATPMTGWPTAWTRSSSRVSPRGSSARRSCRWARPFCSPPFRVTCMRSPW
jgi:MFS family permease